MFNVTDIRAKVFGVLDQIKVEDFESEDEYRKFIFGLSSEIIKKVAPERVIDMDKAKEYIKGIFEYAYGERSKSPPRLKELSHKTSAFASMIRDLGFRESNDKEYKELDFYLSALQSSKNLGDLRFNAKAFRKAVELLEEKLKEKEIRISFEQQVDFDTKNEDLLEFYKQQNKELIDALSEDDSDSFTSLKLHRKINEGRTLKEACEDEGIDYQRGRRLVNKYQWTVRES